MKIKVAFLLFISIVLSSGYCFSQKDNIEQILQTVQLLKDRPKKNDTERIKDNLQAVQQLKKAIELLPKDEDIYVLSLMSLAETYISLGLDEPYYIDHIWEFAKYDSDNDILADWVKRPSVYYTDNVFGTRSALFWEQAEMYLDEVKNNNYNKLYANEAASLLAKIASKKSEYKKKVYSQLKLTYNKMKIQKKKDSKLEQKRDYSEFFQIGVGRGFTYGDIGLKASYYTAPDGFSFIGGAGTGKTRWVAGIGVGINNTYSENIHLQMLVGERQYAKLNNEYKKSINMSLNLNIDIKKIKHLGLNFDGGVWVVPLGDDTFGIWGGSFGIYYKF